MHAKPKSFCVPFFDRVAEAQTRRVEEHIQRPRCH